MLSLHSPLTKQILRFKNRSNLIVVATGDLPLGELYVGTQDTRNYIREFSHELEELRLTNSIQTDFERFSVLARAKLLYIDVSEELEEERYEDLKALLGVRLLHHNTTIVLLNKCTAEIKEDFKSFIRDNGFGHRTATFVEGTESQPIMTGSHEGCRVNQYFHIDPLASILSLEDKPGYLDKYPYIGFLDIDGVLQHNRTFLRTGGGGALATHFLKTPWKAIEKYDQELLAYLSRMSYHYGVKWVLSSAQRAIIKEADLQMWAKFVDLPIVDITGHDESRELEIVKYIQEKELTCKTVVLDDGISQKFDWPENTLAIKVNPKLGVTLEQMENMSKHFNVDKKTSFRDFFIQARSLPEWY